jgi:oxygen-independent coproporphyrinogen-3 oxidase
MRLELLQKYSQPVPRYTSYPTAPHFHDGVDQQCYGGWLTDLADDAALSVYIHVPYCDTLCWFCGCHTKIVNRYDPIRDYLDLVAREILLVREKLGGRRRLVHLHFGGGSPSLLKPEDVENLAEALHDAFDFDPTGEFAIEIDPRETTRNQIEAWAKAGLNRASLGLQDFNPKVQKAINRIQTYEETEQVVNWLRELGIKGINFDLMYGLPHQTEADVANSVEIALSMQPDRVALFGYAHVPWMKTHMKLIPDESLPNADERVVQSNRAANELVAAGLSRIGLDHFAQSHDSMAKALKAGSLNRNFQGYTVDRADALIGLGASAIGAMPGGYVQNHVPIPHYRRAIEAGELAVAKGIALSNDDRLRRAVIERLMCDLEVDLAAICRAHQVPEDYFEAEMAGLKTMASEGIVEIDGQRLAVTTEGRALLRTVAAQFDIYLASNKGRHSIAV